MKPVCVNCKTEFVVQEAGVVVVETFGSPPTPYKLWHADAYVCPGCGNVIVAEYAERPYAVHHEDDFPAALEAALANDTVYYANEKPSPEALPFSVIRYRAGYSSSGQPRDAWVVYEGGYVCAWFKYDNGTNDLPPKYRAAYHGIDVVVPLKWLRVFCSAHSELKGGRDADELS